MEENKKEEKIDNKIAIEKKCIQHCEKTNMNNMKYTMMMENDRNSISGGFKDLIVEISPGGRYTRLNNSLGIGSYKKVFKAIDVEEGIEVAWCSLQLKNYESARNERTFFLKEIEKLSSINHPNVIKVFDFWFTEKQFVFITEFMTSGTLSEYIQRISPPKSKVVKKWAKQILEGLAYLHSLSPPIIHRDLKCENIFINGSTGEVKIGDLGIAKKSRKKRCMMVGTPEFMAKELFEREDYGEKIDIYSFGMTLIEMSLGEYPYSECISTGQIYEQIIKNVAPEGLERIEDGCLRSLIYQCIEVESKRLTALEALEHHFFDPENMCIGECSPSKTPVSYSSDTPVCDAEIRALSFHGNSITFQIFSKDNTEVFKFIFDLVDDSIEDVVNEMVGEGVIKQERIPLLCTLLSEGIIYAKTMPITPLDSNKSDSLSSNDLLEVCMCPNGKCKNLSDEGEKEIDDIEMKREEDVNETSSKEINDIKNKESSGMEQINTNDSNGVIRKKEYDDYLPIEEFVMEAAIIANRDQKTAIEWTNYLHKQDIKTVADIKILVEEDWDKLNLTVFSSRAMKNLLYGKDKQPIKEKDRCINTHSIEFDDSMQMREFISKIVIILGRDDIKPILESKLITHDLRTLGELRSLHQDDWDRLGLSAYSYRIIKNIVERKGYIIEDGKVIQ
ncbi:Serine/threonine-protein kinase pkpA [Astathelohania contejeani]|uniref:Serine/threonine-protein kinase pkpA n=1 Tax=Astathelohania contejeani TaxID=164912 RepID=A0ABQ7HZV3_9MICR|nr:Serine/threonine-protein kinase pkpA [Thelohania contejeani]